MKKIVNIFLALAAIALVASSCKKEVPYQPGEPDVDGCYGVYFPVQETTGDHTFDPTMPTTVEFTVARTNSDDEITVPVDIKDDNNIYVVSPIHFAAGQAETSFEVSFPDAEMAVKYPLSITITDPQYASRYAEGAISIDFSAFRVEWKTLQNPNGEDAIVTFYEEWWDEIHECRVKYYEVNDVRTCIAYTEDPEEGVWGMKTDFTFTWNIANNAVDIPQNFMGWDYDDQGYPKAESECSSPVYVFDWFSYWTMRGQISCGVEEFYKDYSSNYPRSYYDPETGIFYFNCQFYIIGVGGWTGLEFDTEGWIDGFVRVDYSIEAETDYCEDGISPVYFTTGVDVAEIKYTVVDGAISATAAGKTADSIIDGSAADIQSVTRFTYDEEENVNYSAVGLELAESGVYTLVAVTFDADGNAKQSTSVSFEYVAADDDSADVDINCTVEPTPARYASAGFNEYNSYAYSVWGSNLTDVKIGLYKYSDVAKYGLDVIIEDLRYEDEKTTSSVSESILATINGVGGYSSVFSKLADNTDYVLFAWGTNGKKADYVYQIFSTEKYPETYHSLGIGLYTDDIIGPLFGADPISYEVEIQESDETPGRYKLVYPYGEAFPYNEPGDYDDSSSYDIVVEASDPEHVYIRQQDTGCNWGYGMMSIVSEAGRYVDNYSIAVIDANNIPFGKLADGIITMPTRGMIVFDDDGGYYGNNNGKFQIVLPSAYKTSGAPANVVKFNGGNKVAEASMSALHSVGVRTEVSFERAASTVAFSAKGIAPKTAEKVSGRNMPIQKGANLAF